MNNKLSNEELKEIIQEYQNLLHGCCVSDRREIVDIQNSLSIAREALAYREAESKPVGSFHIFNGKVEGTTDFIADGKWPIDYGELVVYASPVLGQTPALTDVIAERQRQISVEGRTLERDDNYKDGSMAVAAACYARLGGMWNDSWQVPYTAIDMPCNWPWPYEWWKLTNPRRDLVKAAALILAEIERLDRALEK